METHNISTCDLNFQINNRTIDLQYYLKRLIILDLCGKVVFSFSNKLFPIYKLNSDLPEHQFELDQNELMTIRHLNFFHYEL